MHLQQELRFREHVCQAESHDFPNSQKALGLCRISKFPVSPQRMSYQGRLYCPDVKVSIAQSFALDRSPQGPLGHGFLLHAPGKHQASTQARATHSKGQLSLHPSHPLSFMFWGVGTCKYVFGCACV